MRPEEKLRSKARSCSTICLSFPEGCRDDNLRIAFSGRVHDESWFCASSAVAKRGDFAVQERRREHAVEEGAGITRACGKRAGCVQRLGAQLDLEDAEEI